jgi:hypothetical protein
MKWVNIAAAESLSIVLILAAAAPRGHKKWPFLGGMLALVVTYGQYLYAKMCGIQSTEPPTENFNYDSTNRQARVRPR